MVSFILLKDLEGTYNVSQHVVVLGLGVQEQHAGLVEPLAVLESLTLGRGRHTATSCSEITPPSYPYSISHAGLCSSSCFLLQVHSSSRQLLASSPGWMVDILRRPMLLKGPPQMLQYQSIVEWEAEMRESRKKAGVQVVGLWRRLQLSAAHSLHCFGAACCAFACVLYLQRHYHG